MAAELVPIGFQSGTQLLEVERFTVEDDGIASIVVGERLMAQRRSVNDAEPPMSQYRPALPVSAFIVGAAVCEAAQGITDPITGDWLPWVELEGTRYAAHVSAEALAKVDGIPQASSILG
jgi:hypothetical protein